MGVLLTLAACSGTEDRPKDTPQTPHPEEPPLEILQPSQGALITHARLDLAVGASAPPPSGSLRLELNGIDISSRMDPPYRRMLSLGGGAIAVGQVNLDAIGSTGTLTLKATWSGSSGPQMAAQSTFTYRPASGLLQVEVRVDQNPTSARLFIEGLDGTPDPDFTTPGAAETDPRSRDAGRHILDSATGREAIHLSPGRYRITASHGIEDSTAAAEIDLSPSAPRSLALTLHHQVDTPGWISADLHVHASPSNDSFVPLEDRVRGYLAAGVELLVATDHHTLTDYAPVISRMPGAASRITSIVGVETGLLPNRGGAVGHWNLFPFARRQGLPSRPWPMPWVKEPAGIYRLFRQGGPEPLPPPKARNRLSFLEDLEEKRPVGRPGGIIEVNHPRGLQVEPSGKVRGLDGAAWFSESGLDPSAAIPKRDEQPGSGVNAFLLRRDTTGKFSNLDFDALELLNRFSLPLYRSVRDDWFALLAAGYRFTGTANSDSHHRVMVGPGFPRNLVRMGQGLDTPAALDLDRFDTAIREGHVVGTTGPVIELSVTNRNAPDRAGPGDTLSTDTGDLEIKLTVRAASWIPVREVRIFQAGRLLRVFHPSALMGPLLRLETALPLRVTKDTWIMAEAGDPLDGSPSDPGAVYKRVAPGFSPIAFTNPVYIDMGGDGWKP